MARLKVAFQNEGNKTYYLQLIDTCTYRYFHAKSIYFYIKNHAEIQQAISVGMKLEGTFTSILTSYKEQVLLRRKKKDFSSYYRM